MKQYLLSIYQPEGAPDPEVLEPIMRNRTKRPPHTRRR